MLRPQAPSRQTGAGGGAQGPGLTARPRGSALPLRTRRSVRLLPTPPPSPCAPAGRAVHSSALGAGYPLLGGLSGASPSRGDGGRRRARRGAAPRAERQRGRSGGRWAERRALRCGRGAAWSAVGREPAAVADTGGGCAYLAGSARRGGRAPDPGGVCAAAAGSARPRCAFPPVGLLRGFY